VRISDLVGLVHGIYPPALADDWDNVGLQVGDPSAAVRRVLVCLDPTLAAVEQAAHREAQVVLSHHPLLLRPAKTIAPTDETGRILFSAIRRNVAIVAAHTNLDRARDGLNDWLAAALGLTETAPLCAGDGPALVKLVVFVPAGHEEAVAEALFAGGAGGIGAYDRCAFRVAGTGSFRPGAGTRPFVGSVGQTEEVAEVRLETILRQDQIGRVVPRLLKAHPYEEVAYDLYPLLNRAAHVGLGRIGRLSAALPLAEFAGRVKAALGAEAVRRVGDAQRPVRRVAVCGGSGASLIGDALRQGADVLVTGDVKYHDARRAEAEGLALVDAGHFATERLAVSPLAAALRQAAEGRGLELEFLEMEGEQDPFCAV